MNRTINQLLDSIEGKLVSIRATLTTQKNVRVKKTPDSGGTTRSNTDYTEQIEKLFRYWKRPLTPSKAWQLMQKKNYTDSASPIPPKAFVSALKTNFLAVGDNRYPLTLA